MAYGAIKLGFAIRASGRRYHMWFWSCWFDFYHSLFPKDLRGYLLTENMIKGSILPSGCGKMEVRISNRVVSEWHRTCMRSNNKADAIYRH